MGSEYDFRNVQSVSKNSLSSSTSSISSNQSESQLFFSEPKKSTQHGFDLDPKEYDKLKQSLLEIDLQNEFKILSLIPDDEARDVIGSWTLQNQINQKISPIKPLVSRPTFSYSYSTNLSYQFRNFNDWRSHLIFYKQKKNGPNNLPNILKELKQTNIAPTVVKRLDSDDLILPKTNLTRSQTLFNLKRENNLYRPVIDTKVFETDSNGPISVKGLGTKTNSKGNVNDPLPSQNVINFSAPGSISNGSVHKQNIDFKMELPKQKTNEIPNQKFIPYLRGKRAGGGVLRVSSDVDKNKIQLQQIPNNILKKFINQKSNSFNSGLTSIIHNQTNDDTYYSITSIGTNEKKYNGRKYVSFYVDEGDQEALKSVPSRASDHSPVLDARKLKSLKSFKSNDKFHVGQPSLTQFIQSANFVNPKQGANIKNFKQIANRIKKEHKEILKKQQESDLNTERGSGKIMMSELKGVGVTDKNLINQTVRVELTN